MVRNSGKFGKPKRGGAKRFTPARELKADAEDKEGMWEGKNSSDEDEDEDEEAEEEEDSDESESEDEPPAKTSSLPPRASTSNTPGPSSTSTNTTAVPPGGVDKLGNAPELSAREAKKLAKQEKARKAQADSDSDDDDDVLNAGRSNTGLAKQMKATALGSSDSKPSSKPTATAGMNRREREEAQKKIAREKYLELHRAGKTTEAKSDLARLAVIRKEREEAAARKAAEKADQDDAKAKAMAASGRKR